MQHIVDIEKMQWAGWFTPAQMSEYYQRTVDALHVQPGLFEALGSPTLVTGFAVLFSVPLIWATARLNRG